MATRASKKEPKAQQAGVWKALLAMNPQEFDRKKIVAVTGEISVASMPKVAEAFGKSAATVRRDWRANGMPGESGNYSLPDILLWKLELDKKNEKHKSPTNRINDEMKQLELRKQELAVAKLEVDYQENQGQLVPIEQARAEVYAMLAVTRKSILEVPRALLPLMPRALGPKVAAECEKLLKHVLRALSEKSYRSFMKEGQEDELQ